MGAKEDQSRKLAWEDMFRYCVYRQGKEQRVVWQHFMLLSYFRRRNYFSDSTHLAWAVKKHYLRLKK